ncbi:MAG: universal stress protein [Desulfopila sp.]
MLKKILVPIAFSKYSEGIITYAADLARPFAARLLIVNVVDQRDIEAVERISSYGYKVDANHYITTIQHERSTQLEKLLSAVDIDASLYEYRFLAGDPTTELLKLVLTEEVDMVVMGSKAKELRHIFTGSVAERMFRRSPVAIVSYRSPGTARELKKKFAKELKS